MVCFVMSWTSVVFSRSPVCCYIYRQFSVCSCVNLGVGIDTSYFSLGRSRNFLVLSLFKLPTYLKEELYKIKVFCLKCYKVLTELCLSMLSAIIQEWPKRAGNKLGIGVTKSGIIVVIKAYSQ